MSDLTPQKKTTTTHTQKKSCLHTVSPSVHRYAGYHIIIPLGINLFQKWKLGGDCLYLVLLACEVNDRKASRVLCTSCSTCDRHWSALFAELKKMLLDENLFSEEQKTSWSQTGHDYSTALPDTRSVFETFYCSSPPHPSHLFHSTPPKFCSLTNQKRFGRLRAKPVVLQESQGVGTQDSP